MKFPFSIDRSYKVRHKILETLHKDWEANNQEYDRRVGSIKIATETKTPIADIHLYHYSLVDKGEIVVSNTEGQLMMSIQLKGINSFIEKQYLKEGRKTMWDGVFDWARILIPLGALILSVINFISNRSLNDKIKNMESKIEQQKK